MRSLYRLLHRVSPWLARFLKNAYWSLDGWRFDDLKRAVEQSTNSEYPIVMSIDEIVNGGTREMAFVTNLPPEETGIATCSYYSWLGQRDVGLDLYGPVVDVDWFIRNRALMGRAGDVRVFDIRALLTGGMFADYKYIVVAVGNSPHSEYLRTVLRKMRESNLMEKVAVYLHDPCVLNFVRIMHDNDPVRIASEMRRLYRERADVNVQVLYRGEAWHWERSLIDRGVLGARYFYDLGVRRFLVNSGAAKDLVVGDLDVGDAEVSQVFHPAFLPDGSAHIAVQRSGSFVIGTFGVPGNAKRTGLVFEAVAELRRGGLDAQLVVAGYGANEFVSRQVPTAVARATIVFDNPTNAELRDIMASVDIAVQLRERNLGESSGVVPQLLMLGKNVVVSDVGSFREYGAAVKLLPEEASATELAEVLMQLQVRPIEPENIRRYIERHTPTAFRSALLGALRQNGSHVVHM